MLIRSALFYLYFTLVTIFYSLILVTLGLFVPFSVRSNWACAWGRHSILGLKIFCGLDYHLSGTENLKRVDNAVILCKHQSAWETIFLRALLPSNQSWVLKRELIRIPFFGWGLAMTNPIAINRGTPKQALKQVLDLGVQRLKEGHWLVIFPEGTRVTPGERKRYGASGAMLAKKAGVDVIPVVHNAGYFWKPKAFRKTSGTIEMVIGEPISTPDRSAKEIMDLAEEWIENEVLKLPIISNSDT